MEVGTCDPQGSLQTSDPVASGKRKRKPQSGKQAGNVIAGDKITVKFEEGWFRGTAIQCVPNEETGGQNITVSYDDGEEGEEEGEEVLPYPDPDGDVYCEGHDELPPEAEAALAKAAAEKDTAKEEEHAEDSEISVYEQQRVENIKRNLAFMATLNMSGTKDQMAAAGMMEKPQQEKKRSREEEEDDDESWDSGDDESQPRKKALRRTRSAGPAQITLSQNIMQYQISQRVQHVSINPGPTLVPQELADRVRARGNLFDPKEVQRFCCIADLRPPELAELLLQHDWQTIRKTYNPGGGNIRRGPALKEALHAIIASAVIATTESTNLAVPMPSSTEASMAVPMVSAPVSACAPITVPPIMATTSMTVPIASAPVSAAKVAGKMACIAVPNSTSASAIVPAPIT